GGEMRSLGLDGAATYTADAASHRRFVRMLIVEHRGARLIAITPPDRGAIAPRALRLPEAPADAAVIENPAYDALADWLHGGGRRLSSRPACSRCSSAAPSPARSPRACGWCCCRRRTRCPCRRRGRT